MSNWTSYVTKFYRDKKRTNASYKFSMALKDAAKVYKQSGKTLKASKSTRKTRKNKRR
jgi:hypothetical protein